MAYSEAQKNATLKYRKAHKEQLTIDLNPGEKERYKAHAAKKGMSLTACIKDLLEKDMETPAE